MKQLTHIQLAKLHEKSSMHRADLRAHDWHSCFHCLKQIEARSVKEYTDNGCTGICPACSVDALLPGEWPHVVLQQMYARYFVHK